MSQPSPLASRSGQWNAVVALTTRIGIGSLAAAAGSVLVARVLGPDQWGRFTVAIIATQTTNEIMARGYAVRLLHGQADAPPRLVHEAFTAQLLAGVAIAAVVLLVGAGLGWGYGDWRLPVIMAPVAAFTVLVAARTVPIALLERAGDYGRVSAIELADSLSFVVVATVLAVVTRDIVWVAPAFAVRAVVGLAVTRAVGAWPSVRLVSPARALRSGIGLAGGMGAISALGMSVLWIPTVGLMRSQSVDVLAQVQMALLVLSYLLLPVQIPLRLSFVILGRQDDRQRVDTANRTLGASVGLVGAALFLFIGAAPLGFGILLGDGWDTAARIAQLLAVAYLLHGAWWPTFLGLASTQDARARVAALALVPYLVVYLAITAWLGERGGMFVALGMLAAAPMHYGLLALGLRRTGLDVPSRDVVVRSGAAIGLDCGLVALSHIEVNAGLGGGILLAAGWLFASRGLLRSVVNLVP